MLKLCFGINDLNFRQLMDIYEETNQNCGRENYPEESDNLQILFAEQDFYQYIELFFQSPDAVYAVWDEGGHYLAALRLERYNEGYLVTALEVLPEIRKQGYGTCLLGAVVEFVRKTKMKPLYSHVHKNNKPSLAVHKKCGFRVISDDSLFLDGSKHNDYHTFYCKTENDPAD